MCSRLTIVCEATPLPSSTTTVDPKASLTRIFGRLVFVDVRITLLMVVVLVVSFWKLTSQQ
jgi:hypothetical protein